MLIYLFIYIGLSYARLYYTKGIIEIKLTASKCKTVKSIEN